MDAASPKPRKRTGGAAHPYAIRSTQHPIPGRAPMNRVGSDSSASLFFGPSIPSEVLTRTRTKSNTSPVPTLRIPHPVVKTRHSYSGITDERKACNTIQARANSPSPDSSPARLPRRSSMDDDEEMFFGGELHTSSF